MDRYKVKTKSKELPSYFPLTLVFSGDMPPTEEHSHDCTEIGIIVKGRAVHVCDGEKRILEPGDIIILLPEQRHSFPETDKLDMYNVLFHTHDLNLPQQDLMKFPGFLKIFPVDSMDCPDKYHHFRTFGKDFQHIRNILMLMYREQKDIGRSGFRSAMMGLFMNLMCHLLRSWMAANESKKVDGYEQNIDSAIQYLKEHFLEPFDLNTLLKISAMSRSNFMKRFHASTGMAPKQFIIRKRIDYAARRIVEENVAFSELAMICGFHDSSHFSKVFKRITDESPRDYRRRMIEKNDREVMWNTRDIENPFIRDALTE